MFAGSTCAASKRPLRHVRNNTNQSSALFGEPLAVPELPTTAMDAVMHKNEQSVHSLNYSHKKPRRVRRRQERWKQTKLLLGMSICLSLCTWYITRKASHPRDKQDWRHRSRRKNHGNSNSNGGGAEGAGGRPLHDTRLDRMKQAFHENHNGDDDSHLNEKMRDLEHQLNLIDGRIHDNRPTDGIRWVDPGLLPALHKQQRKAKLETTKKDVHHREQHQLFYKVPRLSEGGVMAWETEYTARKKTVIHDFIDYTQHEYQYPKLQMSPPTHGQYPNLQPLKDLLQEWPQDVLDNPPEVIQEKVMHFDYNIPEQLEAAKAYRDAKLPFKLTNVPEVVSAGQKWTDDYIASNFDGDYESNGPLAHGTCQESVDNFFAFFIPKLWSVPKMGIPPTRNNDWTYAKWAKHAQYADHVGLASNRPHFYWQAGVDKQERKQDKEKWCFISRDLPSFSSPTKTFFVFEPNQQKGIQCRFGERGVTAATHYDSGRNFVAMVTGAKRYILSPPRECSKLGIVNNPENAIFRHSMLNFGHLIELIGDTDGISTHEREWLQRAGSAESLSTVLKAGEVLYIPSFWFHYITSLQKSAQCNVRSGVDTEGDRYFGSEQDVKLCNVS